MIFEIVRNGRVVCWTSDPQLIDDRERLEQLISSGHTLRLDGREVSIDKVLRIRRTELRKGDE
ncbi:hypothetical protein [Anaerotruncus rubiinfantis]|nr:hypothetical protein [Anaerotruncus rubiinfantis]